MNDRVIIIDLKNKTKCEYNASCVKNKQYVCPFSNEEEVRLWKSKSTNASDFLCSQQNELELKLKCKNGPCLAHFRDNFEQHGELSYSEVGELVHDVHSDHFQEVVALSDDVEWNNANNIFYNSSLLGDKWQAFNFDSAELCNEIIRVSL